MRRWSLLVWIVVAVALVWCWGEAAVNLALDQIKKGRRLTSSGSTDPDECAAEASRTIGRSVSVEAYALARMIRSEHGSAPAAEKVAIAHVALNDRVAHGWSLIYTLTGTRGTFGPQKGVRYSTARDPYEGDLAIAELVLSGRVPDNTGGAVKFVHVSAFGLQAGTRSYASVRAAWAKEGLHPFEVPGASDDFRVFRRTGGAA